MRKLWDKIVRLLYKVGEDKWFHFIAGVLAAAAAAFAFNVWYAPLAAAAGIGLLKEVFDLCTTKVVDWKDWVATTAGGAVITLLWLLTLI